MSTTTMVQRRLSEPSLDDYSFQSTYSDGQTMTFKVLLGFNILFSDDATGGNKASLSLSKSGTYVLLMPRGITDDSTRTEDLLNSKFWRILLVAKGHLNKFVADGRPEHKWYSIYLKDL
jgi:hypothetical protein